MGLLNVGGSTVIMKPAASWTQTILSWLKRVIVVENGSVMEGSSISGTRSTSGSARGAASRVESSNVTSARLRYGLNLHFVAALH